MFTRAAFPLQLYLLLTENGLNRKKRIGNPVFQARTDAAITEINTDIEEIKGQLSGSLANLGSSTKDTTSKLKVGLSFKHWRCFKRGWNKRWKSCRTNFGILTRLANAMITSFTINDASFVFSRGRTTLFSMESTLWRMRNTTQTWSQAGWVNHLSEY